MAVLMEKARCPRCNSLNVKRHCKSSTCVWFICSCVKDTKYSHIVFDRSRNNFWEMKK